MRCKRSGQLSERGARGTDSETRDGSTQRSLVVNRIRSRMNFLFSRWPVQWFDVGEELVTAASPSAHFMKVFLLVP